MTHGIAKIDNYSLYRRLGNNALYDILSIYGYGSAEVWGG